MVCLDRTDAAKFGGAVETGSRTRSYSAALRHTVSIGHAESGGDSPPSPENVLLRCVPLLELHPGRWLRLPCCV